MGKITSEQATKAAIEFVNEIRKRIGEEQGRVITDFDWEEFTFDYMWLEVAFSNGAKWAIDTLNKEKNRHEKGNKV